MRALDLAAGDAPTKGTAARCASSVEQARAQAVVDVVGVIGDIVGDRRGLRLEAGVEAESRAAAACRKRGSQPGRRGRDSAPTARLRRRCSGPLCLTRPSSVSRRQVEAVEIGVAALELGDDAQRLAVVVEAAVAPPCRRRARPRRCGRTACGRGRGRAPPPRRGRRRRASARASARAICATSIVWVRRVRK